MRNHSIFWARLLGLYFIIIGFWVLLYGDQVSLILMSLGNSPALLMVLGVFALLLGLVIIVSHNIWHKWPTLITVIGYLITIKGAAFLFFPRLLSMMIPYWRKENLLISVIPTLVLGIILLYFGYFRAETKS